MTALPDWLHLALATHGVWLVGAIIGVESVGLPLPGEAALLAAAIYAGSTGNLSIASVLAAALVGAVLGDSMGYLIGRMLGWPFLVRHGPRFGLSAIRLGIGRALFLRHGGKVVFLGRFVAFLRVLAASLAGASGMSWPRFFAFNLTGAVVWVGTVGGAGYVLGTQVEHLFGPIGMAALGLAVVALFAGAAAIRREERRMIAEAGAMAR